MRRLNGFICICAVAMLSSIANAQMRVVLDGEIVPAESIDSIIIMPVENELNITTTASYNITVEPLGNGAAINSFSVSPLTVLTSESATLSWVTSNAVTCEATNGVGGWSGTTIVLPESSKTVSTAVAGTYTFTLTCTGSENETATRQVVLTVDSPDSVAITSLSASPNSVSAGGNTTLNWETANASSCTASGGTDGWNTLNIGSIGLSSGSAVITTSTEGTFVFTLTCEDSFSGQATKNVSVTVTPNVGSCDASPLSGNTVDWSSFWGDTFPAPRYRTRDYTISKYSYVALEFNTGSIVDDGRLISIENTKTAGIRTGAISECPGDFNVPAECDYTWGLGGSLGWATNGRFGYCELKPNTTYYFNITFTDGFDPQESTCVSTPCVTTMQHQNY